MSILVNILVSTLSVLIASYLLPGVEVTGFLPAVVVAVVLGVVNSILKPILILLTLPLTILSLGLFTFVISALMVLLVDALIPGFQVNGFWWALLFSLLLSIINSFLHSLSKSSD